MGSDKIIHFTETHLKNKYTDFCIDMSMSYSQGTDYQYDNSHGADYQYDNSAPNYDGSVNEKTSNENEYDYHYSDNSTAYDDSYYPDSTDLDLNETGCFGSMGSSEDAEHHMVAVFCDYEFIEVRKCCDKKQNLNLRYNNSHEINFFSIFSLMKSQL